MTQCTVFATGGCGAHTDAGIDAATSTCSSPGTPTAGPADSHCANMGADGGALTQTVSTPSCCAGADAAAEPGCPYGATMFGMEGDDDDCKYHVTWTSTPICEGSPGVQFVVTAVSKTTTLNDAGAAPAPVTGANVMTEVFTTTTGDWDGSAYCDDMSTHPGPTSGNFMTEGPPGTYTANVVFDQAGQWTIRFHFNEECLDVADDSPHGHAAFHFTVP